jgi:hypothetical protein
VPRGAALRAVPAQVSSGPGWRYDPRGWVAVTGDGAVLSNLAISCNLDIRASNVVIRNVRLTSSGQSSFGISIRHTSNVTIEDSTISGLNAGRGRLMVGIKDTYGNSTGLRMLDNNIFLTGTGVQVESGLIQGNYIHDMGYIPGDHLDGIHSDGGGRGLLIIRHNTILMNHDQTGAVVLNEDAGTQVDRVVSDNLLAGGGYTIYAGQGPGGPVPSNIEVIGNRVSTIYYPGGGQYGPAADFNAVGSGNSWTGNVWDSTGKAIAAPPGRSRVPARSRSA